MPQPGRPPRGSGLDGAAFQHLDRIEARQHQRRIEARGKTDDSQQCTDPRNGHRMQQQPMAV